MGVSPCLTSVIYFLIKMLTILEAGKIAQWVKALKTKPVNLSFIPGTHEEGEGQGQGLERERERAYWHSCSVTLRVSHRQHLLKSVYNI